MNEPRYYLSHDKPKGFTPASKSGRVFRKDVLRVGTYKHPTNDWVLDVTPERLDRMASTFNLMLKNGVTSDVTVDHSTSARDKIGKIVAAVREGDTLYLDHEFADEDAEKIAERVGESSLEIEPVLKDGRGNTYIDAIVANSIVRQPVVPGQSPFVRIAASRTANGTPTDGQGDSTAIGIPFHLSAEHATEPSKEPDMKISDDQRKKLLSLTGLDDKAADDKLAEGVVALAEKGKAGDDSAKTLETLKAENAQLKAQVESLSKGKAPEADPDVLEETAENRKEQIDGLVAAGNITPAVGEKLAASLIGEPGKRNVICLSRKAATHAGLTDPIAKTVIDILKGNNPVDLKPKSGPQVMTLSRQTPGVADLEDKNLKASVDEFNKGAATDKVTL